MKKVEIYTEYIKLDAFLKLSGEATSGGHAKELILAGEVMVNGERCYMRGKKLRVGDVVALQNETIEVVGI